MQADVKVCVDSRISFFEQYYTVPPEVQGDVDAFIREVTALGEASADAAAFEAAFASGGLSDRFNALLPRCTPKAFEMTAEQKDYSKQVAKEMLKENKEQIIKDIATDVGEFAALKLESDANTARIRAMSEAGVYDDYTRAKNVIEDAEIVGGFLGKLFGKKKKKDE